MEDPAQGAWTSEQLLDLAQENRYTETDVSPRKLETWRSRGLLPHPTRVAQAGLRPIWLSPPETGRQLLRLLELRRHHPNASVEVILVLLWLSGGNQNSDDIRQALRGVLDEVSRIIEGELDKTVRRHRLAGDTNAVRVQALGLLADQATVSRVANTVLQRVWSARGHRIPGMRAMLHTFVIGEAPPIELGTGDDVERALGLLPRGRLDHISRKTTGLDITSAGPWHDGQPVDLPRLASVASLPALRRAIDAATDEDLAFARRAVAPLTGGLAFSSRLVKALYGENFAGFTLLRSRPRSDFTAPIVAALVISLAQSDHAENVAALVDALERTWAEGNRLLDRLFATPGWLLAKRKTKGHPREVQRLERVMQEFHPQQRRDSRSRP